MPEKGIIRGKTTPEKKSDDFFGVDTTTMMIMMGMLVVMMPIIQQVSSISSAMQAQQYVGALRNIVLTSDPALKIYNVRDPYPWSFMIVKNPGTAYLLLGINSPDSMVSIAPGATYKVDRIGAQERINSIYYQSPPGTYTTFEIDYEY